MSVSPETSAPVPPGDDPVAPDEAGLSPSGPTGRQAALVARYGRTTLLILILIMIAGFLPRAWHVINPDSSPGDDALAYRALAESLYEHGTYGGPEFKTPSDWSPGAPLIYAGSYFLTGGVRDGVARGVEALFGTAAILIAFLLTNRLIGPPIRGPGQARQSPDQRPEDQEQARPGPSGTIRQVGPLVAAALVAFYPPFVDSTGSLMSEPPAFFMLPAAVLAFFWAAERRGALPWLLPGILFGVTTLIRPEYMLVTALFGLFLLIRTGTGRDWRQGVLATVLFGLAALLPVIPWTVHNYVQLDRVVPISTGSGKALFTGTNLPADGEYQRVKATLLFDQTGERLKPGSPELNAIDPVPLFDREAARYPGLDRDAALGRIGKENFRKYFSEQPLDYLAMTVRKVGRMWGSGADGVLSKFPGSLIQKLLVLAGLAGLVLLVRRRRFEAIAMAIPILTLTAVGALTLAPPRRNEILMMLILPLVAVAFNELIARHDPESRT